MRYKPIKKITLQDVERVFANHERETKSIEFKRQLNLDKEGKRKLVQGLCAFANTHGGDMIVGIDEEKGVEGFNCENLDELIRGIEDVVRSRSFPKLSLNFQTITKEDHKIVLVIRVNEGREKPYAITNNGNFEFYIRGEKGKQKMSYFELRDHFGRTQHIQDRIKSWIQHRKERILSNDASVPIDGMAKLCLHLIPVESFIHDTQILDVTQIAYSYQYPIPIYSESNSAGEINLHGYLSFDPVNQFRSYVQVFNNGCIEAVNTSLFIHENTIPSIEFVEQILFRTYEYIEYIDKLNCSFPIVLGMTLIGLSDFKLGAPRDSGKANKSKVDDVIDFRLLTLESKPESITSLLRPWFDHLWRAFGYTSCSLYQNDGSVKISRGIIV